jgi:hypothetical protein
LIRQGLRTATCQEGGSRWALMAADPTVENKRISMALRHGPIGPP